MGIRLIGFINENLRDFTSLDVWKKCRELKLILYKEVFPKLPNDEKYNLLDQIRRACTSTTSDIAEGYGRYHYQESIQFYRISRGSLYELKDHIISCFDLGYVKEELIQKIMIEIEEATKLLNGYIRYLEQRKVSNHN